MDEGRFDRLARRWASPATRRGAIRAAAGGVLAAALAALSRGEAEAGCPRNRRCDGRCCPKGKVCRRRPQGGRRCVRRDACPRERRCGGRCCPQGQVCCNPSCQICTPPDGVCTQQACV